MLEVGAGRCLVHYTGWSSKHDEWVQVDTVNERKVLGELSNVNIKKTLSALEEDVSPGALAAEEEDPAMAGLCEYEKVRLRNIREREQLFASLQFEETKSELRPAPPSARPAASKRGLAAATRVKEVLPLRPRSARLAGEKVSSIDR